MGHCSNQSWRAAPLGSRLGPYWPSITCWQGQSLDLAEHQPSDVTIAMLAGFCTMLMAAALPSLVPRHQDGREGSKWFDGLEMDLQSRLVNCHITSNVNPRQKY